MGLSSSLFITATMIYGAVTTVVVTMEYDNGVSHCYQNKKFMATAHFSFLAVIKNKVLVEYNSCKIQYC